MELQFEHQSMRCQDEVLHEIRDVEQTQEIRLSEDMPDIQRVISCWGQPILRTKDWMNGEIQASGGVMVWVLYQPEGTDILRKTECWIPFQLRWDAPEEPLATVFFQLRLRQLEGRNVTARKILVKAGIACLAEGYTQRVVEIPVADKLPEGVEVNRCRETFPVLRCTGEKSFRLEETLQELQTPKIIGASMEPTILGTKIAAGKLAFHGQGKLNLLTKSESGTLEQKEYTLAFSQFAEPSETFSQNATAWVTLCVSDFELDDGENGLEIKCGIHAQYSILDTETIELVTDAYCLTREMESIWDTLQIPSMTERKSVSISSEVRSQTEMAAVAACRVLNDFPRLRDEKSGGWQQHYNAQLLGENSNGMVTPASARWEADYTLNDKEPEKQSLLPGELQFHTVSNGSEVRIQMEEKGNAVGWRKNQRQALSGVRLGEPFRKLEGEPSLVLRRAGGETLWSMAKEYRTTVAKIKQVNNLEGEPERGKMLLIPKA